MRLDWQTCKSQPGLFHAFGAASPGSRVKQWPAESLSQTDVLRSKIVQQSKMNE